MTTAPDIGERRVGRPRRDVPASVAALARRAYAEGGTVVITLPGPPTEEDIDRLRLDLRAAGRHIAEDVTVTITGVTGDDHRINVNARRERARWPEIVKIAVRAHHQRKGSIR